MTQRDSLPADLKRRVLLEAGHRCAIPTCLYPTTEIHHIIPWATLKQHSFENLIALCPNCHTRADAGEIDRKSLRLYKVRLSAAFGVVVHIGSGSVDEERTSLLGIASHTLRDSKPDPSGYELILEYPQFDGASPDHKEISLLERAAAVRRLQDFRKNFFGRSAWETPPEWSPSVSSLEGGYSISAVSDECLSIKYSFFGYMVGAAHPNHWSAMVTYQRSPAGRVSLYDLFSDPATGLSFLRSESQRQILSDPRSPHEPSVIRGTTIEWGDFEHFNVTPEGLLFTFDPYMVSGYADGSFYVAIPFSSLPGLDPDHPVVRYWNSQ